MSKKWVTLLSRVLVGLLVGSMLIGLILPFLR